MLLQVLIELRFAFFRAELRGHFCELLLLLFVGAPRFPDLAREFLSCQKAKA